MSILQIVGALLALAVLVGTVWVAVHLVHRFRVLRREQDPPPTD